MKGVVFTARNESQPMAFQTTHIEVENGIGLEVRLHGSGDKAPVVCIPGLTRNAADFDDIGSILAASGRTVAAVSLRGRGRSDRDPHAANYFPTTYRDDILRVLDALNWSRAIFVGTSLGGITTMLTHEKAPDRVAAAVINDVGPDLAPEGIARIAGYVGQSTGPASSWEEAAARIKAINDVAFPDATDAEWLTFAKRTFRETGDGYVLDYDPKIAEALAENGPAPDLWSAWEGMKPTPTLLVHGDLSDLLTPPIIEKMRAARPGFAYVKVPRIGHAPMMTEPAALEAIQGFVSRLDL